MSSKNQRIFLILSAIGLAVGLLGLIIVVILFAIVNTDHNMYSVVLDAGSSSTKLNLFTWKDKVLQTNAEVKLINNDKVEPGISAYVGKPFEAYHKLSPNLASLVANIPSSERSRTPVYLAATAGMRLKLLDDPLGSLELFEVLRRGLLKSGLMVETPNERIRMLSGAEEGLFGWVSVNNILGLITANKQVITTHTVGSLDLGGASTQISFVPGSKPPSEEAGVDYYSMELFGITYEVYSHSFLCYGKNEFENRVMAALIAAQTPSPTSPISHPCLLQGYTSKSFNIADIFGSPCVTGPYAAKAFPQQLTKPTTITTVTFTGTGNATQCKKIISDQFPNRQCTTQPCSFNNVFQPAVRGQFRAYSGFSFVMKYLFKDKKTNFTINQVTTAVQNFCARQWNSVQPETGSNFATKYCFDGYYLLVLLDNFGFKTDTEFGQITFGDKIDGQTVSWGAGFMLDQSGQLPSEIPNIYIPVALFVSLVIIFIIIIVISIVGLVFIACRRKKA